MRHDEQENQACRERAAKSLDALPDYEVLELLLARSIPRGDVKPLAKALLARFGDLAGVHGASLAELKSVPGVGAAVALDLKLVHETARRMSRAQAIKRPVISSWSALTASSTRAATACLSSGRPSSCANMISIRSAARGRLACAN